MRIISGTLGGRSFDAPKGKRTHPMSDKMRSALFNMLGDVSGLSFLDAFAGSGGLGLEAMSRGASQVLAIEADKTAHQIIRSNATTLKLPKTFKPIHASVHAWSKNNESLLFDVVLADPPYDDLKLSALEMLVGHLKQKGLYVLSWPGHLDPPQFPQAEQLTTRNYGDAQLVFYRKNP